MNCLISIICHFLVAKFAQEWFFVEGAETSAESIICEGSIPDLNNCIRDKLNEIIPYLKRGYPALDIPSYDPYIVLNNSLHIDQNNAIGNLQITSTKIYGFSKSVVQRVELQLSRVEGVIKIRFTTPVLNIVGRFYGIGVLKTAEVQSQGTFNIKMTDVINTWTITGVPGAGDGEAFAQITDIDIVPEVSNMTISATGLFPDINKNDLAVVFINEYWKPMYNVLILVVIEAWKPTLLESLNEAVKQVSFNRNEEIYSIKYISK